MADVKITEVVGGVETVKTESPIKKVKPTLSPKEIERLIREKQRKAGG